MGNILPFAIPIIIFLIPIIAILTHHQRKMAELMHGSRVNGTGAEIDALRREVQELKEIVHQQTLAIDNISRYQLPQKGAEEHYSGA